MYIYKSKQNFHTASLSVDLKTKNEHLITVSIYLPEVDGLQFN